MTSHLFAVAAATEDDLLAAVRAHADRIRGGRNLPPLDRYCHDAATGTAGLPHRATLVADSYDSL
ncbi:hypothetical protein, partial [Micromonospora humida]